MVDDGSSTRFTVELQLPPLAHWSLILSRLRQRALEDHDGQQYVEPSSAQKSTNNYVIPPLITYPYETSGQDVGEGVPGQRSIVKMKILWFWSGLK